MTTDPAFLHILTRIAQALERIAPPEPPTPDWKSAEAFMWQTASSATSAPYLAPVVTVNRVDMSLLKAIDRQRDTLLNNTRQFAGGQPANNALLWGARGMGKSSLVKAVHAQVAKSTPLKLIEIHREDINTLPHLMSLLRGLSERFIIFCDDLSFDNQDVSYKSLKAALEGGLEGRPSNVVFYATSNRRHLLPRDMIDNERSTAINPGEAVEEKVSLSDRFGLWIGFHKCSQEEYLEMVRAYAKEINIQTDDNRLRAEALEWSMTRGDRSGRVAWQFIVDFAGK